ncbi:hypothetical protein ACFX2I_047267 [Malus domestica]
MVFVLEDQSVWSQRPFAKLCIVFLPFLCAALLGISRVDDYWIIGRTSSLEVLEECWCVLVTGHEVKLSLMRRKDIEIPDSSPQVHQLPEEGRRS